MFALAISKEGNEVNLQKKEVGGEESLRFSPIEFANLGT